MNIRAERRRMAACFFRAGIAELDRAAKDRGFEAPVLPSQVEVFADSFREKAKAVVAHDAR